MKNPIGWFEIYVQDMERARKFYESVFQVTLQKLESPTAGIELLGFPADMNSYGAGGALAKMEGISSSGNSTIVYFSCADCAVEEARVAAAGGQVLKPKMSIAQFGWISIISDSEGNVIGLHSMK